MPNYSVDDSGSHILVTYDSVVIETIAKEAVVMQVVLAGESLNKSGIDELWIQHDGKYTSEIPYTDVLVDGDAPSSVEDFRTKTLALVNDNPIYSGSAYTEIVGHITQENESDPTIVIIYNNTGITLTPSRYTVGGYYLTPSVELVEDRTFYTVQQSHPTVGNIDEVHANIDGAGRLVISTADLSSGQTDGKLVKSPFEIRIYP